MHIDHYVRQVQEQLSAAAALGDERTQQIASTIAAAAAPSVRLAVMAALAAAADEITAALLDAPSSPTVAVRLDGDTVRIDVVGAAPEPAVPRADEGDASARITLRLTEALKADVEEAAAREGVSVNTWLVRAASSALTRGGDRPPWADAGRRGHNTHRVTGWING
ncbi:MAG: putative transcriptional regulator, CopG family [Pseudonocardiales bacterium]|nr:putative transcriptional regulator, CopG family [Pseudonocardiales bacterium]